MLAINQCRCYIGFLDSGCHFRNSNRIVWTMLNTQRKRSLPPLNVNNWISSESVWKRRRFLFIPMWLTKLWDGNVFSRVCLSVFLSTVGGSHVTITYDSLDLAIQGPPRICWTCYRPQLSLCFYTSVHAGIPSPGEQSPSLPPQKTATAADGTHPTGMHSCSLLSTYG